MLFELDVSHWAPLEPLTERGLFELATCARRFPFVVALFATLISCTSPEPTSAQEFLSDRFLLASSETTHTVSLAPSSVSGRNITVVIETIENPNEEAIALQFDWVVNGAVVKTVQVAPFPPTQPGSFVIAAPEGIPSNAKVELQAKLEPISENALSATVSVSVARITSQEK